MPKGQIVPKLKKPRGRSAVTNGSRLFVDKRARGSWARRYADLVSEFVDDRGGASCVTALQMSLIRRAAALTLESERLECSLAMGEAIDLDLLQRMSGQLRRLGETLGLGRAPRSTAPTIADIAARHAAQKAAERDEGRGATPAASSSPSRASGAKGGRDGGGA